MGKAVGGAVLGYVVMFAVVMALMSGAYVVLGANGTFQPGNWDISGVWVAVSIGVGLVAAIGGGYVCAWVAKDPRGPMILMGLVLVLGIVFAIPALTEAGEVAATARPDEVPMFDAMSSAQQPGWLALLNPVLGIAGVFLGALMQRHLSRER